MNAWSAWAISDDGDSAPSAATEPTKRATARHDMHVRGAAIMRSFPLDRVTAAFSPATGLLPRSRPEGGDSATREGTSRRGPRRRMRLDDPLCEVGDRQPQGVGLDDLDRVAGPADAPPQLPLAREGRSPLRERSPHRTSGSPRAPPPTPFRTPRGRSPPGGRTFRPSARRRSRPWRGRPAARRHAVARLRRCTLSCKQDMRCRKSAGYSVPTWRRCSLSRPRPGFSREKIAPNLARRLAVRKADVLVIAVTTVHAAAPIRPTRWIRDHDGRTIPHHRRSP